MSKNIVIFLAATLFFTTAYLADAQQAIFLVRHGETVAPKGTDARPLSEAGQRSAALLATLLKDAGIKAIFTSDLERTIKTAEPLAQGSGLNRSLWPNLTLSLSRAMLMLS